MNIVELLDGKRVCISVGAGGVGKTTTSAAVALGMAARGLKVAVVTIDPARRLANALGLEQLDNEPRLVSPARVEGLKIEGELWAMMLDPKRTFDELIDRIAPSPERAEEIKRNSVYRELSTAVSGSQEFTAIEKLYELVSDDYDLIVLDTPPAHNAVEFLNAPGRLTAFLGGGALQAFLRPTGFGMRLLGIGAAPMLAALKLVTGVNLMSDLTSFFALLGGMTEEFSARAKRVEALLHAHDTAFVLVTSAEERPIEEAMRFRETLRKSGMPFSGAIVNRVHPRLPQLEVPLDLQPDLSAKVTESVRDYTVLSDRDADNLERLRTAFADEPILQVTELATDVHDMQGLLAIHQELFR
ncbi:MAG TPA: ArsA-related P-loop ATPase [Solirubrobacteraceae bacterium]|jgi:anion-transporting  ArsA/GET3 family ATPase|nr:ArsA-related P-loop ATPase [Solirubrobacteraceae bacterium]